MPSSSDGDSFIQIAGPRLKFLIIILVCTIATSFTMIMDCPRALKTIIMEEMKIKNDKYELQYYFAFWPNIFSWLAGIIVDRYLDLRIATVIFLMIACLGNTLYAIGAVTLVYEVMLTGRLITSVGVEACYVFVSCYIIQWFPSKLTNTVFALFKSLPLLGGSLVFQLSDSLMANLSKNLQNRHALSITIAAVMSLIVIPLACVIILALISKSRQNRGNSHTVQQTIKFLDIIKFPIRFWFLAITTNVFFCSCLIFLRLNVLNSKYRLNEIKTNVLISTFTIGASLMAPIMGLIVDWKGRNLTFITIAALGGASAHFALAFIMTDPFYPMILLSFSYSMMIASYWSLYRSETLVKSYQITTAFGIDNSLLMMFCAISSSVAPYLMLSRRKNALEIFYLFLMIIAVTGSCVLWGIHCRVGELNPSRRRWKKRTNKTFTLNQRQALMPQQGRLRLPANKTERRLSKTPKELNYLRLKRAEIGSNIYKYQRRRRQIDKLVERRRSRSNEELNRIK